MEPKGPGQHTLQHDDGANRKPVFHPSKIEKERDRIIEAFSRIIQEEVELDKLGPSLGEHDRLASLVPGVFGVAGISAACLAFFSVRYLPSMVGHLLANSVSGLVKQKSNKGKKATPSSPRLSKWIQFANAPYKANIFNLFDKKSLSEGSTFDRIRYVSILFFHYVLSLGAAALVSAMNVNDDSLWDCVSRFPLAEGKRSPLVHHICPKVMELWQQELQRTAPLSPKHYNVDTESVSDFHRQVLASSFQLQALQRGVQNCALRFQEEDRFREEQGLSHDQDVDIPPPGVIVTETTAAILVEDAHAR